jgi:hypothetical protein
MRVEKVPLNFSLSRGARWRYKRIGYFIYVFVKEVEKHVFYGDLISTTQY